MEYSNNPYQKPQSELDEKVEKNTPKKFSGGKIFTSQGRLGRVRYLVYSAILQLLYILFDATSVFGDMTFIVTFLFVIPWVLFVTIQRLHDINLSGWWALFTFVPYHIGALFMLLLLIIPGTNGSNQFGPQPPPNTKTEIAIFSLLLLVILVIMSDLIWAYFSVEWIDILLH